MCPPMMGIMIRWAAHTNKNQETENGEERDETFYKKVNREKTGER